MLLCTNLRITVSGLCYIFLSFWLYYTPRLTDNDLEMQVKVDEPDVLWTHREISFVAFLCKALGELHATVTRMYSVIYTVLTALKFMTGCSIKSGWVHVATVGVRGHRLYGMQRIHRLL